MATSILIIDRSDNRRSLITEKVRIALIGRNDVEVIPLTNVWGNTTTPPHDWEIAAATAAANALVIFLHCGGQEKAVDAVLRVYKQKHVVCYSGSDIVNDELHGTAHGESPTCILRTHLIADHNGEIDWDLKGYLDAVQHGKKGACEVLNRFNPLLEAKLAFLDFLAQHLDAKAAVASIAEWLRAEEISGVTEKEQEDLSKRAREFFLLPEGRDGVRLAFLHACRNQLLGD